VVEEFAVAPNWKTIANILESNWNAERLDGKVEEEALKTC